MTRSDLELWPHSVQELLEAWEAAWSGRDEHAFTRICTLDVRYEDPLTDEPLEGAAALGAHAARLWSAFPDARLERFGVPVVGESLLCAPAKLLGTHRQPLEGLPASGRFVVVPVVFYCQVRQGRMERVRAFFDAYGAGVQLGILPGRGTLGGKALLMLRGFGLRSRR